MKKIIWCIVVLCLYESLHGMEGQKEDPVLEQPKTESMLGSWAIVENPDDTKPETASVEPATSEKKSESGYSSDGERKQRKHQTLTPKGHRHRSRTKAIVKPRPIPPLFRQERSLDLTEPKILLSSLGSSRRPLQRTPSNINKAKDYAKYIQLVEEFNADTCQQRWLKVRLALELYGQFLRHKTRAEEDGNYLNSQVTQDIKQGVELLNINYHDERISYYTTRANTYFNTGKNLDDIEQLKHYMQAKAKVKKALIHLEAILEINPTNPTYKERLQTTNKLLRTIDTSISFSPAHTKGLEHWQKASKYEKKAKESLKLAVLMEPTLAELVQPPMKKHSKTRRNTAEDLNKELQSMLKKKRKKLDALNKKAEATRTKSKHASSMMEDLKEENRIEKLQENYIGFLNQSNQHYLGAAQEYLYAFDNNHYERCIQNIETLMEKIAENEHKSNKMSGIYTISQKKGPLLEEVEKRKEEIKRLKRQEKDKDESDSEE